MAASFGANSLRIALTASRSRSSSFAICWSVSDSWAVIVSSAAPDEVAAAQEGEPVLLGRELAELAGDEVVLGAAVEQRLVVRDLRDEDRLRLREAAVLRDELLDRAQLRVADVHVGRGGAGQDVGEGREEPRPIDRQRVELAGDPPDRLRVASVEAGQSPHPPTADRRPGTVRVPCPEYAFRHGRRRERAATMPKPSNGIPRCISCTRESAAARHQGAVYDVTGPGGPAPITGPMRVGVMAGVRDISVLEVDVPEPEPGQILVRLRATAICTWEQRTLLRRPAQHVPVRRRPRDGRRGGGDRPRDVNELEVGERVAVGPVVVRQVPLVPDRPGSGVQASLRGRRASTARRGGPAGSPSTSPSRQRRLSGRRHAVRAAALVRAAVLRAPRDAAARTGRRGRGDPRRRGHGPHERRRRQAARRAGDRQRDRRRPAGEGARRSGPTSSSTRARSTRSRA